MKEGERGEQEERRNKRGGGEGGEGREEEAEEEKTAHLRLCRGAAPPQTPCGRSVLGALRSGGGSKEAPAPPGYHGRRQGDCPQWERGRSDLERTG